MTTRRHLNPLALSFDRGSLRQRFALGIALMLLPMLLLGGASVYAYERSVEAAGKAADEAVFEAVPLAELSSTLRDAATPALATFYGDEPVRAYREIARVIDGEFASLLAERGLVEERADVELAAQDWQEAKAAFEAILRSPLIRLPRGARIAPGPRALAPFSVPLRRAIAGSHRASRTSSAQVLKSAAAAHALQNKIELLLGLTGLAAILGAVLIARRLSRSVIDPVVRLQEASRKLGSGDFSERVEVDRTDEVGALAVLFNTMAQDLEQHEADLRSTQERLAAAQKLEAVGHLAGGIAHDFNNLMHVVGSYADLLHESFDEDDPRRIEAAEIRQASDRATARTRQLLTFSRRDVIQPVPLDTTATITRLEETLRRPLPDTVELRLELEPDLPATVIDTGELEQVLLNLVSNAQNAMPDGGTLTIRTTAVEIGDRPIVEGLVPGDYVAITVSDTGHGMSEAVRSHALEPFFTTRRDAGGSGLGLATVYGIVTGAGGSIVLESHAGEGTAVVLYLPTTSESADATTENEEPSRSGEREDQIVVLVAEDEPTIRALTTRMLSAQGYKVLSAPTGVDALNLARSTNRVDVLLTDVIMPGMSGNELAATLARERPGLAVVFMSGYSDQIVTEGVLDADTLYLPKPFKPQELLDLLALALAA